MPSTIAPDEHLNPVINSLFLYICVDNYNLTFSAVFNASGASGGYVHAKRVDFGASNYIFWTADAPAVGNYTYVLMNVDNYAGSSMPKQFVTPTVRQSVCRKVEFAVGSLWLYFMHRFSYINNDNVCRFCTYSCRSIQRLCHFNRPGLPGLTPIERMGSYCSLRCCWRSRGNDHLHPPDVLRPPTEEKSVVSTKRCLV